MCTYIPNIEALGIHATEPIANGELQANEEALLQNDLSDMQLKESPPWPVVCTCIYIQMYLYTWKKIDLQYTVVSWYHGLWYWAGLLPQLDAQAYFLKQIFAYILLGISSHACRLHQGKHCIIIYSIIQGELSGKCELMFQIVVIFFMTFSIPAGWVCRCRTCGLLFHLVN